MSVTAAPPPLLARFRGPLTCRRGTGSLTLRGPAADSATDILILTFIGSPPADLPDSLPDAAVLVLAEGRYRLTCGSRDWLLDAASVHLHRDIGATFRQAIPPRPAPLAKRLFWRLVLALAATGPGKRLLLTLRRK